MVRAADTTPELMKLGEPKAVGSSDDDRIRTRQVDAAFNNRCAGQNGETLTIEIANHTLEFSLRHLAMRYAYLCFWDQRSQPFGSRIDCSNLVMQEKHLAAPVNLAQAGFSGQVIVPWTYKGFD